MNWIVFHIIESMSSHKQSEKKIGYLAANLCFQQDSPVLMLCTNLIKKDLASNNVADGAMALHTLAQIANADLARDLHTDVLVLLNHSNAYMRKRAVITLYKLFTKYPDSISSAFPRLKERLGDEDPSVVCATVSVICEMAHSNPKAYLPFVPQFFALLSVSHNWTLIKIVKLFATLTPHEPRLEKKLIKPLKAILEKTRAISLVFEVVHTIITSGMIKAEAQDDDLGNLCLEKLLSFLDQTDQNLKFLGLDALSKLLLIRPTAGGSHREIILKCLEDGDISIRMRALELVTTLVNEKTLFGIVKRLIVHLTSSISTSKIASQERVYRSKVVSFIITQCSKNNYSNLTNFEWFISVICELVTFTGLSKEIGSLLGNTIIEVCIKVPETIPHALSLLVTLLNDEKLLSTATATHHLCDFLYAAAWISGEYSTLSLESLAPLLVSPSITVLSPQIQSVYLFAFLKVYTRLDKQSRIPIDLSCLDIFLASHDMMVQERATLVSLILKDNLVAHENNPWIEARPWSLDVMKETFGRHFNMVAPQAQKKMPISLDLNLWLVPLSPRDVELQASPTRMVAESVESLFQTDDSVVPFKKLSLEEEKLAIERKLSIESEKSSKSVPRGVSVFHRPEPKKYQLNNQLDGKEYIQAADEPTSKEKGAIKKSKSKSSKFLYDKKSLTCTIMLGVVQNTIKVFGTFRHTFSDQLCQEIAIDFKISTNPLYPLTLLVQSIQLPSDEIRWVSKRSSLNDYFDSKLQFQVQIGTELLDVSANLPFAINFISPKAHKMNLNKFLDIVRNTSKPWKTVLTFQSNLPKSVAACIEQVASQLFCSFHLIEDVGSLYGATVKQAVFVGLAKAAGDKVSIEWKCTDDCAWLTAKMLQMDYGLL